MSTPDADYTASRAGFDLKVIRRGRVTYHRSLGPEAGPYGTISAKPGPYLELIRQSKDLTLVELISKVSKTRVAQRLRELDKVAAEWMEQTARDVRHILSRMT